MLPQVELVLSLWRPLPTFFAWGHLFFMKITLLKTCITKWLKQKIVNILGPKPNTNKIIVIHGREFLKALIRSLKGLIRPYIGPNKGLIRPFKALIRPLKGLIRPYGSISFVSLPGNEQGGVGQQGPSIIAPKT